MYNESDTHTGCEGCGEFKVTRYTNNIGFYCGSCLEGLYEQEFRTKQDYYILSKKLFNYLCKADCRKLTNSSVKYFKSKYLKQYLTLSKTHRHYVIRKMISVISSLRFCRENDESFYNQNESITNSMLNLLIKNRR